MQPRERRDTRRRFDAQIASDDAYRGVTRAGLRCDPDAGNLADRSETSRDLELLHVAFRERRLESHDGPGVARRDREIPVLELRISTIRGHVGVADPLVAQGASVRGSEPHGHEPVEYEWIRVRKEDRGLRRIWPDKERPDLVRNRLDVGLADDGSPLYRSGGRSILGSLDAAAADEGR